MTAFLCNLGRNSVLGHDSALKGSTGLGTTLANDMNFGMKHAPGAGLIA